MTNDPSPKSFCSGSREYYTVSSAGYTFQQASGANSAVTGGPGVTLTIGTSKSGTTSSSGAWRVPANYKIGKLQIGALKYQGTIRKYLENSSCTSVLRATTIYNAPQQAWHFQTSRVA
jgi:hypothetical protein